MTAEGDRESAALEHAVERLVSKYLASRDERILVALDGVEFDAGNGVQLCRFYRGVLQLPELLQHYRSTGAVRKNLRRCAVASGIARSDYERIANEEHQQ
jgi:hypothetical protein